ncbi:MAG: hypothetical protein CMP51_06235 [Flavobacteriales bacterium]|nr:hypothetical protein [Flavobacteriales bacterium]|tara:strand:- start:705 stop:1226 length:522 start_codon:yes stop_codon:yes gene_type:complete
MKIIITGAPGTGKTSIINHLNKKGYKCVKEGTRSILNTYISKNSNIKSWKEIPDFSELIFKYREKEVLKTRDSITFFDRSIIDTYCYMKMEKMKIPDKFTLSIHKNKYHKKVFYTPMWEEIYKIDNERKEGIREAIKIEKNIIEIYSSFSYEMIMIPKSSIKKRMNFIFNNLH